MIRLFTSRALRPSYISVVHRKINPFLCSSLCGVSAQEAIPTRQNTSSMNKPCSHFDSYVYGTLLQRCIQKDDLVSAMGLHCKILKTGNCLDLFATNILLSVYVKAELLSEAEILFDEMPERNTISFVTLVQGYMQCFHFAEAVGLFARLHREGHELNPFVFTSILKVFVSMECPELGWNLHACIYKLGHDSNAFVGTALIDAYSVCGCVDMAREVFNGIRCKDMVTWTGMLACYAENNFFQEALEVFSQMRLVGFKPNNFTFAGIFKACIGLEAFDIAKGVHGCVLKTRYEHDMYVGVAMLELYTKCGNIDNVQLVFEEIPKTDVIPWSFMISRFAQSDLSEKAVNLFCQMRQSFVVPNQYTYASALQACATSVPTVPARFQIPCLQGLRVVALVKKLDEKGVNRSYIVVGISCIYYIV